MSEKSCTESSWKTAGELVENRPWSGVYRKVGGVRPGVSSRVVTLRTNLTLLVSESREKGVESWTERAGSES